MCGILLDHSGGIIQSRARSKRNIKENALRFEALKTQGFSAILVVTGAYHCVSLNTEGDACPSTQGVEDAKLEGVEFQLLKTPKRILGK